MKASFKCRFDVGFYGGQDIIYLTTFVDIFLPHTLLGRFNLDNALPRFAVSVSVQSVQYLVVYVCSPHYKEKKGN